MVEPPFSDLQSGDGDGERRLAQCAAAELWRPARRMALKTDRPAKARACEYYNNERVNPKQQQKHSAQWFALTVTVDCQVRTSRGVNSSSGYRDNGTAQSGGVIVLKQ